MSKITTINPATEEEIQSYDERGRGYPAGRSLS